MRRKKQYIQRDALSIIYTKTTNFSKCTITWEGQVYSNETRLFCKETIIGFALLLTMHFCQHNLYAMLLIDNPLISNNNNRGVQENVLIVVHLSLVQFVWKSWSSFYGLTAVLNTACHSHCCHHFWNIIPSAYLCLHLLFDLCKHSASIDECQWL